MPRFKVTLEETAVYEIEVKAKNKSEAAELAEAAFLGSITCAYPTEVTARDVTNVEKL